MGYFKVKIPRLDWASSLEDVNEADEGSVVVTGRLTQHKSLSDPFQP